MNSLSNAFHKATDAELLMRFVKANDESCFEAIVARHSNLVFQVCQTILLNHADAEDAFQATFVVLVRKSKCLLKVNSLAAWLYKVAYRIAIRANQTRKRKSHESLEAEPAEEFDQFHQISRKEILSGVFDELARLPSKYKEVLVECYLQGRSYRAVAEATDSTEVAVKGRLAQAKKCLRKRLLKRGIALSFVLIMLDQVRSASVANCLIQTTTIFSLSALVGESSAKIATSVQSLTKIGIKKMSIQLMAKPLSVAFLVLVATIVPLSWALSQPVGGQEKKGVAINSQDQSADTATKKLSRVADPFGGTPASDPFGGGGRSGKKAGERPKVQDAFGNNADNPFENNSDDPFGGYPKSKKSTKTNAAATATRKTTRTIKTLTPAEAEARIEKSLAAVAGFDFVETPLVDVADELAAQFEINVHLDRTAIEDAGYDVDLPLTGKANNRSLRSALRFLFQDVELEFIVKNETLIITTPEAIVSNPDDYLVTRMYDVTDLAKSDANSLIQAIEKNVAVNSWGESGYASLNELTVANKMVLVVSHTSEHQVEIQTLLENLRKMGNQ